MAGINPWKRRQKWGQMGSKHELLFIFWHKQEPILLSTFQLLNQSSPEQKEFLRPLQTHNFSYNWLCSDLSVQASLPFITGGNLCVLWNSRLSFIHSQFHLTILLTRPFLVWGTVHFFIFKITYELILSLFLSSLRTQILPNFLYTA